MEKEKRKTKYRSKEFSAYLGKRLKYYRQLNKCTQDSLAKALGLSFQQIQKYESGKNCISLEKFILFAKTFNLSLEELLGELFYPKQARFSNEILETLCFAKKLKVSNIFKNI
ncbi:helix-turn-helix transcriptional regulator [bacterium]|nr:helix-turn-helix transcriptional regulator [bacterium]